MAQCTRKHRQMCFHVFPHEEDACPATTPYLVDVSVVVFDVGGASVFRNAVQLQNVRRETFRGIGIWLSKNPKNNHQ